MYTYSISSLVLLGGLTAVIFTDVLQCVIMIIGAIVLSILSKCICMPLRSIIEGAAFRYTLLPSIQDEQAV